MKPVLTMLHDEKHHRNKNNLPLNDSYYLSRNAAIDLYNEISKDKRDLEVEDDDVKCRRIHGGSMFGIPLKVEGEE